MKSVGVLIKTLQSPVCTEVPPLQLLPPSLHLSQPGLLVCCDLRSTCCPSKIAEVLVFEGSGQPLTGRQSNKNTDASRTSFMMPFPSFFNSGLLAFRTLCRCQSNQAKLKATNDVQFDLDLKKPHQEAPWLLYCVRLKLERLKVPTASSPRLG